MTFCVLNSQGICTTKHLRNVTLHQPLWFHEMGFSLGPTQPFAKFPFPGYGIWDTQSLTVEGIRAYGKLGTNFFAVMGENSRTKDGLFPIAVDIDPKTFPDGRISQVFENFALETLSQRTPSGGIHSVYYVPPEDVSRFSKIMMALGAQSIRTTKMYILIAGSYIDLNSAHPDRYSKADEVAHKKGSRWKTERGKYSFISQRTPKIWEVEQW